VDERNAQLEEAVAKERRDGLDALADEYRPYLERERVGVSMGPKPRRPYWQRRWGGGEL
jgi:nitrogenase molybdenum-iron protein alpha/beta subunit